MFSFTKCSNTLLFFFFSFYKRSLEAEAATHKLAKPRVQSYSHPIYEKGARQAKDTTERR